MSSSSRETSHPSIADQIGLVVMLCLLTAVHGPAGDLLARQDSGLARLMAGLLYALSGLLSILAVMALAAVASLTVAERGNQHPSVPVAPSEETPDPTSPDQDPEAWHPDSD
jgi:hypothetical protein